MNIYHCSRQGKSHVDFNIECQDFHKSVLSEDGRISITAVADGVGSCKFARQGAEIAVNRVVEVCQNLPYEKCSLDFLALLRVAMFEALKAITSHAKGANEDPIEYATTLMVVIGFDNEFYYAFCGDGGIVACYDEGRVEMVTTPQKGEDGESVITLLSGTSTMEFGVIENPNSIIIATDGVYDKLCNNKLCFSKDSGLYNNLCYAFMDVDTVDNPKEMYEEAFSGNTSLLYDNLFRSIEKNAGEDASSIIERIKENGYFDILLNGIHDDITLVVISSKENAGGIPAENFREISLSEFLMDLTRQLYPSLSKAIEEDENSERNASAETNVPEEDKENDMKMKGEEPTKIKKFSGIKAIKVGCTTCLKFLKRKKD